MIETSMLDTTTSRLSSAEKLAQNIIAIKGSLESNVFSKKINIDKYICLKISIENGLPLHFWLKVIAVLKYEAL